jgi:pilus assembly protein FimV
VAPEAPFVAPAEAQLQAAVEEQKAEMPIAAASLSTGGEAAVADAALMEATERQAGQDAEDALKIDLGRLREPAASSVAPAAAADFDMSKLDFDLELDKDLHAPEASDDMLPAIDLAEQLAVQQAEERTQKQAEKQAEEFPAAAAIAATADELAPPVSGKPMGFPPDMEGLNLDLGETSEAEHVASVAVVEEPVEEVDDELSSFSKEINTKLDLADAYREIGDKDGAKELLDEVIKAGNKRQVAKAQEMLEQLA